MNCCISDLCRRILTLKTAGCIAVVAFLIILFLAIVPVNTKASTEVPVWIANWLDWDMVAQMSTMSSIISLFAAFYIVFHQNAGTAEALSTQTQSIKDFTTEQSDLIAKINHMALNGLTLIDPAEAQERVIKLFSKYKISKCLYVSNFSSIPHFWHNETLLVGTRELFTRHSDVTTVLCGPRDGESIRATAENIGKYIANSGIDSVPHIYLNRIREWAYISAHDLDLDVSKLMKAGDIPPEVRNNFVNGFTNLIVSDYNKHITSFPKLGIRIHPPIDSNKLNFIMIEIAKDELNRDRLANPTRYELIAFSDFHQVYDGLQPECAPPINNHALPSVLIVPQIYRTTNPVALCSILDLATKVFSNKELKTS